MNREETLKVCLIVQSAYPHQYARFTDRERQAMSEVWNAVLADYTYPVVCAGVKAFIAADTSGFPPSPGQIIDKIHKLTEKPENRLSESEAWSMVYKAICNGIYNAEDEFNKLPPVIQRAVGSADVIRAWAMEENVNVTQSNFQRSYRTVSEQAKEEAKLPQSVTALIGKITERMAITYDGEVKEEN